MKKPSMKPDYILPKGKAANKPVKPVKGLNEVLGVKPKKPK